jgi:nitroimidazol reductase NimA-like FMN-containing flavoprotein (pyridoxamine 5'-phosphate oxidase superfamily)
MVGSPLKENEVNELLAREKTGWLATISQDSKPHLIPIHFGFFNGKVHMIFVDKESKSLRCIENNPSVCFGINVGERAGEIKCVLIRGKGTIIDNSDTLKGAYSKILEKYLPSREESETFLRRLVVSGSIAKRTLVIIEPEKMISWKL